MFAALLLAAQPVFFPLPAPVACRAPLVGAPCVCFPIQHDGARRLREDPLGPGGFGPERLAEETLRAVEETDDVFVRAETLRQALLALSASNGPEADQRDRAHDRIVDGLALLLKKETELAPYSRAVIECPAGTAELRARLEAEKGVVKVAVGGPKPALVCWFDAGIVGAERLQGLARTSQPPVVEPPSNRLRARAAITLGFAAQCSRQLGRPTDVDFAERVREAVRLEPRDARVQLLAAMITFDGDRGSYLVHARDALANAGDDPWVEKNLVGILGAFLNADSLDELRARVNEALERR